MNDDIKKANSGKDPNDPLHYEGYEIEKKRKVVRRANKYTAETSDAKKSDLNKKITAQDLENARNDQWDQTQEDRKILENKILLDFVELESMPAPQFVKVANLSVTKADQVIYRTEQAQEVLLLTNPEFTIPLDEISEDIADEAESLIGVRVIDAKAAKCLNKLAFHNDRTAALETQLEAPGEEIIDGSVGALDEAVSDEALDEAFPKFGLLLILQILVIVYDIIIKMILGTVCKQLSEACESLPFVGSELATVIKEVFNKSGDLLLLLMNILRPVAKFELYIKGSVKVCSDKEMNIEQELQHYADMAKEAQGLPDDEVNPKTGLPKKPERCKPGYKPSYQDRARAQKVLETAIRWENNAVNSAKSKNNTGAPGGQATLTEYTMLERMKSDSQHYSMTAQIMIKKTEPTPGYFIADNVEAGILGFFAAMNGAMQMVDHAVTKILALEFMDRQYRTWVCCIVRFLYLMLPRIMAGTSAKGTAKEDWKFVNEFLTRQEANIKANFDVKKLDEANETKSGDEILTDCIYDAIHDDGITDRKKAEAILTYTGSKVYRNTFWIEYFIQHGTADTYLNGPGRKNRLDRIDDIENIKMWVAILDALISMLLGSASLNITFDKLFNLDFFTDVIKQALAEGLSMLATALYRDLKDKMFGILDEICETLPDVCQALQACEPMDWLLKMLQCALENIFSKIQELLAQMWLDANSSLAEIDFMISLNMNNKSLKFFQDLLSMLLKWDMALINFCSLKKTATEAEKEEIIRRATDAVYAPAYEKEAKKDIVNTKVLEAAIEKTKSIFDQSIRVGPDQQATVHDTDTASGGYNSPNVFFKATMAKLNAANNDLPPEPIEGETPIPTGITLADIIVSEPVILEVEEVETLVKPSIAAADPATSTLLKKMVKSCGSSLKDLLRDRLDQIEEIHRSIEDR